MVSKQTDYRCDVASMGGGAAGLTLAGLLAHAGLDVVCVDPKAPAPLKKTDVSGRTVALMNSSLNVLKSIGIWESLAAYSNPLQTMKIVDDSAPARDPVTVEFPANDIGEDQFGYNIPNAILRAALFEHVKQLKTVDFIEDTFDGYFLEEAAVKVRLTSKKSLNAKLLIGADGRMSAVRSAANIDSVIKHYDQKALTFVINHSRSHENISTEFHRENGPMALVPLPGNQCSVVWVDTKENADALLRLKKSELEQTFQDKTLGLLGGVTLETGPEAWPLCSIKAKDLTAERVALVAEAAHVMSPITAQGLNLSLRDVAALAEEIVDAARLGLDIGSKNVLNAYAKRRRIDVESRVFGVDTMNKCVSTNMLGLKRLRRAGLKSLDALSPIKHLAMHIGLAPTIDQSRLTRGETL